MFHIDGQLTSKEQMQAAVRDLLTLDIAFTRKESSSPWDELPATPTSQAPLALQLSPSPVSPPVDYPAAALSPISPSEIAATAMAEAVDEPVIDRRAAFKRASARSFKVSMGVYGPWGEM